MKAQFDRGEQATHFESSRSLQDVVRAEQTEKTANLKAYRSEQNQKAIQLAAFKNLEFLREFGSADEAESTIIRCPNEHPELAN